MIAYFVGAILVFNFAEQHDPFLFRYGDLFAAKKRAAEFINYFQSMPRMDARCLEFEFHEDRSPD